MSVPEVYLIRHPELAAQHKGICIGRSDAQLSDAGIAAIPALVELAAELKPERIISSDSARTLAVAGPIATRFGLTVEIEPRLRERDFGAWELRPWDAIFAEMGDTMDQLMTEDWAPPGGESNAQLLSRCTDWLQSLSPGVTIAVTHGGTAAALLGITSESPVAEWAGLVPAPGSIARLPLGE